MATSALEAPAANRSAASSRIRSRNACRSGVSPPPYGYLTQQTYRDDHTSSAPNEDHVEKVIHHVDVFGAVSAVQIRQACNRDTPTANTFVVCGVQETGVPAGQDYYGISHRRQAADFCQSMRMGEPMLYPAGNAVGTLALIQDVYRASGPVHGS
ncbi:hypothetical protein [Streptomyces collinus]|uniref:hypothetical protein n=1 Tax=Streptomyces collinus TaxID=42684 RepID=UPI0036A5A8AA